MWTASQDQSLPAWDGDFSGSYFGRLFSAVWVAAGTSGSPRYVGGSGI